MNRFSKDTLLRTLQAVSAELGPAQPPFELIIVGGAAMVLLYDARESTRDVDAVLGDRKVFEAAKRVAADLELPPDWLNDAAKGFVHRLSTGPTLVVLPNLVIRTVSPAQLLAMKLGAWRDDLDVDDARLLLSKLEGTKDEIWGAVEAFIVPGRELKAAYAFEDLWEVRDESQ